MKIYLSAVLLSTILFFSCNSQDKNSSPVELKTELDTMSYYLGVNLGNNLKTQGPDTLSVEMLSKGIFDAYANLKGLDNEKINAYLQEYFKKAQMKQYDGKIAEGKKFLDENKKRPGVVTLPSGLQYEIVTPGTGVSPIISDVVKCHYKGTLIDGTVFDSSYERKEPTSFPVNQVIPGWTEALQLMKVGAKWKLYVPYDIAYGERGAGPIEPYSTLVFEIELLEIEAVKADATKK